MALSPTRSLSFLSKTLKLSPARDISLRESTLLRSAGYLCHVNSAPPSINYKYGRCCGNNVTNYNNLNDSVHNLKRQYSVQQKFSKSCKSCSVVSADTPDRINLPIILSRREKKYCIGKGTFGVVSQASYKGSRVAVKFIPETRILSLKNEANALRLNHLNIIKVIKTVNEQNHGLVLMEMNVGPSIHDLLHLSCAPITASNRIRYMIHISSALEYCHRLKVLHLDVKPKNILLSTSTNICKLCDFGSSVCIDDLDQSKPQAENFGINTVGYTAPDLLCGGLPSSKSDVYSFGVTMWHLLSREIPYEGIDCDSVIYNVVAKHYRPTEIQVTTGYDKKYINLYKLCWQPQPNSRPPMLFVVDELKMILLQEELERINQEV